MSELQIKALGTVIIMLIFCVMAVLMNLVWLRSQNKPKPPITEITDISVRPIGTSHIKCPHCDKEMPDTMFETWTTTGLYRFKGEWVLVEDGPWGEGESPIEEWTEGNSNE